MMETATRPPTEDGEDWPLDVRLDVDPAAALRVVRAAEAGDVHHAALVDVHHAGWGPGEARVGRAGGRPVPTQALGLLPLLPSRQLRPPSLAAASCPARSHQEAPPTLHFPPPEGQRRWSLSSLPKAKGAPHTPHGP